LIQVRFPPFFFPAGFEGFDEAYRRVATVVSLRAAIEQEPGGALAKKKNESGLDATDSLRLIWDVPKAISLPRPHKAARTPATAIAYPHHRRE
jgi:hypothetical protein